MSNFLRIIFPYKFEDAWVFDDEAKGLDKEPFVFGADLMIDHLVADIPDADTGFRLLFSHAPFPGYQAKASWLREEMSGNWYQLESPPMEGWLCPALLQYFDSPPAEIYAKAEPRRSD
ncbi:MAG: hypothetical protein KDI71_03870 [Xanthomonadales bacterium]|nr:hypothetical protein [Xanthomonadales bacterium]